MGILLEALINQLMEDDNPIIIIPGKKKKYEEDIEEEYGDVVESKLYAKREISPTTSIPSPKPG